MTLTASHIGGLPLSQAIMQPLPDVERGKHYELLSTALPTDLFDEMNAVYEFAHQIRTYVTRRAAFGDTADVEHAHAEALKQIIE